MSRWTRGGSVRHGAGADAPRALGKDKVALLVALLLAMGMASSRAHGAECIRAETEKALSCDGKKLRVGGHKPVSISAPKADPPAKRAAAPKVPIDVERNQPRIDRELKKREREYLLREIATVGELLGATDRRHKDHAVLLRRLADDYAELESALYREQMEAEIAAAGQRKVDPSRSRALAAKAKDKQKGVKQARKEAIALYQRLLRLHPRHCRFPNRTDLADRGCADQVMYYLAYEHELARQEEQARAVYLELVTKWPQSKYVPHAYLAFGELFFAEAQGDPSVWPQARLAYEKVASYPAPDNTLWGYASYKLAYVHWNEGNLGKALDHLRKVVEFGIKYPKVPNAQGLLAAARRDLIPVYAQSGEAKMAWAFFEPLSGNAPGAQDKTVAMLEALGQTMLDTGHYAEVITLYQVLLARNGGAHSCRYRAAMTKATLASESGKKDRIVAALEKQLAAYRENKAESYDDEIELACANTTAALLTETAMAWHLEAVGSGGVRGTNDEKTMDAAASLYRQVSASFTAKEFARFRFPHLVKEDWPSLAKVRYAAADLAFHRKEWRDCATLFQAAYEADPSGNDAGEALFTAAQCYNAVVVAEQGAGYRQAEAASEGDAKRLQPKELNADQKAMFATFDRYVCAIEPPAGDRDALEKYVEVKYARARSYYETNHFEEAAAAFRDIALGHPGFDASPFAANLYLESMNVMREKWQREACVGDMRADVPRIVKLYCEGQLDEDRAGQCRVLARVQIHLAALQAAEWVKMAQRGGPGASALYTKAAELYLSLWEEHGKKACREGDAEGCRGHDAFLFNAADAFQAAHLLAKAISVRKILVDPDNKLSQTEPARRAVYQIGANYQAIAVYDLAASWFDRFARESPDLEEAPGALSDAVVLELGLGKAEEALENARRFNRQYGKRKPEQAAQIAFAVGAHHLGRGNPREAARVLRGALEQIEAHASPDVRVQTYALLGRAYADTGKPAEADTYYGKARDARAEVKAIVAAVSALGTSSADKERRLGKALTAIGAGLYHFAAKERAKADALVFPSYTGPGTPQDVRRFIDDKVAKWLKAKRPAIELATAAYREIVELNAPNPPPQWAIAAGAAVGDLWGGLVEDFLEAPYPKAWDQEGVIPGSDPPTLWHELRASYQAELAKRVAPYKEVAKKAYDDCLVYGIRYQHFDERLRGCEQWLSANFPLEHHLIDEYRGTPTRVSSGLAERPQPLAMSGTVARRER